MVERTDDGGLRVQFAQWCEWLMRRFPLNAWEADAHALALWSKSDSPLATILAENTALRLSVETLTRERDEAANKIERLSAEITAWRGAAGSLEAHLQDRIAMNDPARPEVYLSILQSDMAALQRSADQIYAATQYSSTSNHNRAGRLQDELDAAQASLATAEAEIVRLRAGLGEIAALSDEPADMVWRDDWNEPNFPVKDTSDLEYFGLARGRHEASLIARANLNSETDNVR